MMQDTSPAFARQLQLEAESSALGAARYAKQRERNPEADSGPGRSLVKRAVTATAAAIRTFVDDANTGKPGRRHAAVRWLSHLDAEGVAYLTATCCVNALAMGKSQSRVVAVARNIGVAIEQEVNYRAFREDHKGLHRLIQQQLKKSTSSRHATGVMNHALDTAGVERLEFSATDQTTLGMKLIELFIEATGVIELFNERRRGKTQMHIQGTAAIAAWLEQAHDAASAFMPVLLPMVVPPRDWTTTNDGGYLTDFGHKRSSLVRTRNRQYLTELELAEMPEVYEALNCIQATAWQVNAPVLDVMREAWALGGAVGGLPDRELLALPAQPDGLLSNPEHYKEHHAEEFKAWKRSRAAVYEENARSTSSRFAAAQKIALADKFKDEEAIYFPHNLDFRGRVYPLPALLNPQGDDQAKALLRFSEGVALGDDGAFWLAVHLANCFGVDKVPFAERLEWVKANEDAILDSAENPLDGHGLWQTADSPWCALAACFEWLGYKVNGTAHVSHLPIALDGSCNGLQNFSAMLLDPVGGAATNLLPSARPADIYTEVLRLVEVRVKAAAELGVAEAIALDGRLSRKIVKTPVMTLPYGVTRSGMRSQVLDAMKAEGLGDDWAVAEYLASLLWECIGEVVVAARAAMDWLKAASKVASAVDTPIHWTTPVGFPVLQEYREELGKRLRVHVGGREVDITVAHDGTKLDRRRQSLGISPNFVHSCDASHLMLTANLASANGVRAFAMIHDSYGTHAAHTTVMAAALRQAFVDQYRGDVLATFRDALAEQLPPDVAAELPLLPDKGDLDLNLVLDSGYFFA